MTPSKQWYARLATIISDPVYRQELVSELESELASDPTEIGKAIGLHVTHFASPEEARNRLLGEHPAIDFLIIGYAQPPRGEQRRTGFHLADYFQRSLSPCPRQYLAYTSPASHILLRNNEQYRERCGIIKQLPTIQSAVLTLFEDARDSYMHQQQVPFDQLVHEPTTEVTIVRRERTEEYDLGQLLLQGNPHHSLPQQDTPRTNITGNHGENHSLEQPPQEDHFFENL